MPDHEPEIVNWEIHLVHPDGSLADRIAGITGPVNDPVEAMVLFHEMYPGFESYRLAFVRTPLDDAGPGETTA